MRIALAGNPNSGKTTMFNALTGSSEKVGNWAGVTVERKERLIKRNFCPECSPMVAVDLPGAYSMSPFTSEESITSDYVKNERPDVIINIVDSTNLSRSLFFTTQLLELGIPMVLALNKSDANRKRANSIDVATLSSILGCPVVETTSIRGKGLAELVSLASSVAGKTQIAPYAQGKVDFEDREAVLLADKRRFEFVNSVVDKVEHRAMLTKDINLHDKIDEILTDKWLGIPIFALVMFLVFQISQAWLGVWIAEGIEFDNGFAIPGLVTLIDAFKEWVAVLLEGAEANVFLSALLTEGIIGGLSAVVGFLPLVMVMYFLISLLEDCGYMARATVVLDPIFKRVGLSGKSVIPFIVGTGCAIPGVMACRTIRNEREKNATAMLAPWMPCGAKLPVIALFAGAFFDEASWVGTLMYFAGILLILLGALLVNKIAGAKGRKSFFIIELPEYKAPSLKRAVSDMLERGKEYIIKAGTIILLCNTIVFVMQSFDLRLQLVEEGMEHTSILACVADPIAVLLVPIVGISAWQLAAAAVTGFIAKENVVGTLAVCYGFAVNEDLDMIASGNEIAATMVGLTKVAALAYLMFNLFSPPCFAAIGAMNSEITDKRWFWGGIALQLGIGYSIGFLVYQIGTLIVTGSLGNGFVGGLIFLIAFASVLTWLCIRGDKIAKSGAKPKAFAEVKK